MRGIGVAVSVTKEIVEGSVIWQVFQRRQFQARQRQMVRVQVNRGDMRGACGQVVQDVTATRSNRQHAAFRSQLQRLHIHRWVFPNLVVDEAIEPKAEQTLLIPIKDVGAC